MTDDADAIIGLYDRHAHAFDRERGRNLFERPWLDRFLALLRPGGSILDIGCGSAEPIGRHLIEAGYEATGIDSSPAMIGLCRQRFPDRDWHVADMRSLSLGRRFDGVLAWDSLFHLRQDDQRAMFAVFERHAGRRAALMFNTGPRDGVAIGAYQGEPLFHSSLGPTEYRGLLDRYGFDVVAFAAEDPAAGGRTIWLAQVR